MSDINVDLIEQQLGLKLPAEYRAFLLKYPQRLRDTKLDLGWTQEPISERYLFGDTDRILAENRHVRLPGTPWIGEEGAPWPEHMLVIGDDQCGNYWCLDVTTEGEAVWFYDHEIGAFEPSAASLDEYIDRTVRETEEFNRDRAKGNDSANDG